MTEEEMTEEENRPLLINTKRRKDKANYILVVSNLICRYASPQSIFKCFEYIIELQKIYYCKFVRVVNLGIKC